MVEEKSSAKNKFFTVDRARAAFSEGDGVTINDGKISIGQNVGTNSDVEFNKVTAVDFSGINTDVIVETPTANNKFYTDSRVISLLKKTNNIDNNSFLVNSEGKISLSDSAILDIKKVLVNAITFKSNPEINGVTTDNLEQGENNLYYTDSKVKEVFSGGNGVTINNNGVISIEQNVSKTSDVEFNKVTATRFAGIADKAGIALSLNNLTTDNLKQGSANLYYTRDRAIDNLSDKSDFTTDKIKEGGTNLYFTQKRLLNNILSTASIDINDHGQISLNHELNNKIDLIENIITRLEEVEKMLDIGSSSSVSVSVPPT
jgi:hypothetical protein